MSSGELVKPLIQFDMYSDNFRADEKPLQYYVDANDLANLLTAKEIMEAALNSIYEVLLCSDEIDKDGLYIMKPASVYVDNFIYYNTKILSKLINPSTALTVHFKKLTKGRFQIVEHFDNTPPTAIPLFEGEIA
jgi:hypothetical protein